MTTEIAVVVPYFQRREGLLSRCLTAALTQDDSSVTARAYVVDDGSPIPARDEIAKLSPQLRASVTLIEQPNAGAAAARNRALDAISPHVEFVALLDSDDVWRSHHLGAAVRAMRDDVDLYFCDRWITDEAKSGAEASASRPGSRAYLNAPPAVGRGDQARDVSGSPFELVMSGIIPTSGVVYRFSRNRTLRFTARLYLWDDYLFFLALLYNARATIFNGAPGYDVGRGVSISTVTWGDSASVRHDLDLVQMLRIAIADLPMPMDDLAFAKARLIDAERNVARAILHLLRRGRLIDALRPIAKDLSQVPAVLRTALS